MKSVVENFFNENQICLTMVKIIFYKKFGK